MLTLDKMASGTHNGTYCGIGDTTHISVILSHVVHNWAFFLWRLVEGGSSSAISELMETASRGRNHKGHN